MIHHIAPHRRLKNPGSILPAAKYYPELENASAQNAVAFPGIIKKHLGAFAGECLFNGGLPLVTFGLPQRRELPRALIGPDDKRRT